MDMTYDIEDNFMAVIDGNYFTPYRWFDDKQQCIVELPSTTIEKGDAKYMGIAAASILAKTARDKYVIDICDKYPFLNEQYGLSKNMGYGTKAHLNGIQEYGITKLHRHTYGCCKTASTNTLDNTIITNE